MVLLIKCCYANEDAPAFVLTNTNYSYSLSEALGDIKIHKDLLKLRPWNRGGAERCRLHSEAVVGKKTGGRKSLQTTL